MTFPQPSHADTFKSADFLEWERVTQEFYIRTSVGMAGLIAVQNDKKHQTCLEGWYVNDEKAATNHILSVMQQYPDFHPRGVILAVLEKQCGTFTYSDR